MKFPRLLTSLSPAFALSLAFAPIGCSDDAAETTSGSAASGTTSTTTTGSSGTGGAGGEAATSTSASTGQGGGGGLDHPIGGDRPVSVNVPASYDPAVPAPLLILLHGYGATGSIQEAYLQLKPVTEEHGILYAHPDGLVDGMGSQFWNATKACCDFYQTDVDDSGYLASVIADIQATYNVDPKRIFFVGHSNGGFMSYRMACEHADLIAGVAALAGAMDIDPAGCVPSEPVSVLAIHGTADTTISYNGGMTLSAYPSAAVTIGDWVTLNGCDAAGDMSLPPLDLESTIPGDETTIIQYSAGCKPGGHAELWTILGGSHIPTFTGEFAKGVVEFLLAHPKP